MVAEIMASGRTVFLSSHILPEVEQTCNRVAIIREGRLVTIDQVSALKTIRQRDVEIAFAGPASVEWFKQAADVTNVAQGADERTLQLVVQGDLARDHPDRGPARRHEYCDPRTNARRGFPALLRAKA